VLNTWGVYQQVKQMKMLVLQRNKSSKTEQSLSVNLLTWVSSECFERQSEHVLDCCRIHALAPTDCTLSVLRFLAKSKVTVIPHFPYSPDLVPHDTSLFRNSRWHLKERRFNVIMIKAKLQNALVEFQTVLFMKCFA
jgi:hypothetical protein